MIGLCTFLMASFGAALLVKVTVSREPLRNTWINRKPFSCPLCMGFWAGAVLSVYLFGWAEGTFFITYRALAASGFTAIAYALIEDRI